MTQRRKLSDKAKAFIREESTSPQKSESPTKPAAASSSPQSRSTPSLLDGIDAAVESQSTRFCVDLSPEEFAGLTRLADLVGKPKTKIVRFLLNKAISELDEEGS